MNKEDTRSIQKWKKVRNGMELKETIYTITTFKKRMDNQLNKQKRTEKALTTENKDLNKREELRIQMLLVVVIFNIKTINY